MRKYADFNTSNDFKLDAVRIRTSNAVSILNVAQVSFIYRNFNCCEMPYAILSDTCLFNC